MRIYPVPFRQLAELDRYKKFEWVEWDLERNTKDRRPESYKPINNSFRKMWKVGTQQSWRKRRELVLGKAKVYEDIAVLIEEAKDNMTSLAVFKPSNILDFETESVAIHWGRE